MRIDLPMRFVRDRLLLMDFGRVLDECRNRLICSSTSHHLQPDSDEGS
jgi:hypothetical protein